MAGFIEVVVDRVGAARKARRRRLTFVEFGAARIGFADGSDPRVVRAVVVAVLATRRGRRSRC